jgi:hypothetical protein
LLLGGLSIPGNSVPAFTWLSAPDDRRSPHLHSAREKNGWAALVQTALEAE